MTDDLAHSVARVEAIDRFVKASAARRRAFDRANPDIRKAAAVDRHRKARARHLGTVETPLPLLGPLGPSTVAATARRTA